jgi:hypothetical protein
VPVEQRHEPAEGAPEALHFGFNLFVFDLFVIVAVAAVIVAKELHLADVGRLPPPSGALQIGQARLAEVGRIGFDEDVTRPFFVRVARLHKVVEVYVAVVGVGVVASSLHFCTVSLQVLSPPPLSIRFLKT